MTPPFLPADPKLIVMGVGAGALALLLGALGLQYFAGIQPCEMCHWQRWPYIAAAVLGILGAPMIKGQNNARHLAIFLALLVLSSGLIGAYQTGMEYHLLPGPASCSGNRYVLGSGAPPPNIQCDVVAWSLFGISMASWNAICAFVITGWAALSLKRA